MIDHRIPLDGEPAWLTVARGQIGITEIKGDKSHPAIMGWARAIGGWVAAYFSNDDIPWCGLFVGWALASRGLDTPGNLLGARAYEKWGRALDRGAPGAILVFSRAGGGHVGFYVGEDRDCFHVLGGNQSDQVNVKRIARHRLTAIRWPAGALSKPGGPVRLTADGALSTNEA